ncbi:peptidase M23 [Streptomyces sp. NPDC092307]|uniref:CIS tube protein n=1 Tax=Streptomyces sp. NPDC092307 TaxID=3366013 RepID=UPI0038251CF6
MTIPTISLEHATLATFEPPSGRSITPGRPRQRIRLMFNPNRLSLGKSVALARNHATSAESAPVPQFTGSAPRTLSLEAFFDNSLIRGTSVQRAVEDLLDCCEPTSSSIRANRPSPPWVRLEWGRANSVRFNAYLTHVSADYTLFDRDGTPLRATCGLTLEEVGGDVPGQNPTSASRDLQSTQMVLRGDSLELIAYQVYGSADDWRLIADANPGTDAACLVPGTRLILPRGNTATDTPQAAS